MNNAHVSTSPHNEGEYDIGLRVGDSTCTE